MVLVVVVNSPVQENVFPFLDQLRPIITKMGSKIFTPLPHSKILGTSGFPPNARGMTEGLHPSLCSLPHQHL